jgi:ABC-2 type transport system ATP-binding protein
MADAVLHINNLKKVFGRITAVKELNLDMRRGEVLGFLGPNGSGKSTTIGMILGLVTPTSGNVELFGKPIMQCGPAEFCRIGAVLERQPLYPFLSGRDNLEVQARLLGMNSKRVDELLNIVGLGGRVKDKAGTYSQGMRQRLSLAAALLPDPEVLILDEPTNGMDPAGMMEVRELIKQLGKQGKSIFISSHLLHEVEQVSTRVMIIKNGSVLAEGRVSDLLRKRNVLHIRVTDVQAALAIIRSLDWVQSATVQVDMLRIEVPQERAAEITAALAQRNIFPSEIRSEESTLESFFQEVTSSSGDKGTA